MKPRQLSFFPGAPTFHGGAHSIGKRKTLRPLDPKRPIHLVMRSSRARGKWSLLAHSMAVDQIVKATARKYSVRIYKFANVGNHVHLLIKVNGRDDFKSFLRESAGRIAQTVTKARKGKPAGRFWDALAFTRVASWGRDFRRLQEYVITNLFEAAGYLSLKEKLAGVRAVSISRLPAPG